MKRYIKKLLMEGLLSEVTDEVYELIEREYSSSRIHTGIKSTHEFIKYKPTTQVHSAANKPKGFWYGIGTSWLDWVKYEMPEWESKNVFLLDIDDSKILKISNDDGLLKFHDKYGQYSMPGYYQKLINWKKVAEHYDGIEIVPYLVSMRMDNRVPWYYGWDVASGCIWGSGVIKKIKKIERIN